MLTLYGLGTIIGAGIYVLVGEIAGHAGIFAPVSFLVAAVVATFTGLTYGELAARLRQRLSSAGGGEPAPSVFTPEIRVRLDHLAALRAGS